MAKSKTSTRHKAYKKKKAIQKQQIKQKVKQYKQTKNNVYIISPEKKKEYARTAYLNKKNKLQKIKEENTLENI